MKPPEVGMIVGEDSTLVGNGVCENDRIVNALIRSTRLLDS
jgi:hypothetical protein